MRKTLTVYPLVLMLVTGITHAYGEENASNPLASVNNGVNPIDWTLKSAKLEPIGGVSRAATPTVSRIRSTMNCKRDGVLSGQRVPVVESVK